jgi:hypothetical protein
MVHMSGCPVNSKRVDKLANEIPSLMPWVRLSNASQDWKFTLHSRAAFMAVTRIYLYSDISLFRPAPTNDRSVAPKTPKR